ncbi:50S ribosomal protein L11 methyltransferase [Tahibacter soli]|uniref:50S ribosomal protein L11 methyltransferase n=1 Tax=Tahibacter soli TaxID=2983605 RepID=A0A9X4BJF0_9GAMM|nr:50S ribosomal protein L11 methyltransferase [Tahibacter soli]MDC8016275.1 50S ribosomal protein L11 methyltransferase [Tahibacter soli]
MDIKNIIEWIANAGGVYQIAKELIVEYIIPSRFVRSKLVGCEGYYFSDARSPDNNKESLIINIFEVSAKGNYRITAAPIFCHSDEFNFSFSLTLIDKNNQIFTGTWENNSNGARRGVCMLRLYTSGHSPRFKGGYLGPSRNRELGVNGADWHLTRLSDFSDGKIGGYLKKRADIDRLLPPDFFKSVNKRLSRLAGTTFSHDSCTFEISQDGFHPGAGSISTKLYDAFINENPRLNGKTVLDVGTGCGFYAICAAKRNAKLAIGIDIDDDALIRARANVSKNKLNPETVHFLRAGANIYDNVQSFRRFDFILINMPFTAESHNHVIERGLRKIFLIDLETTFKMIVGAALLLDSGGKIYLAYGNSGFTEEIKMFFRIAGLQASLHSQFESRSERETYYIYVLKRKIS